MPVTLWTLQPPCRPGPPAVALQNMACSHLRRVAALAGHIADPEQAHRPWGALPGHTGRVMAHIREGQVSGGGRGGCGAEQDLMDPVPPLPQCVGKGRAVARADGAARWGLGSSTPRKAWGTSLPPLPMGGRQSVGGALTGPGTDAPGLAGLCSPQTLHPEVVVPGGFQAIQYYLWQPYPHL